MDINLTSKTREELRVMALELEPYIGKVAPALGEAKLREIVSVGLIKQQKAIEKQAEDELTKERQEKLGATTKQKGHPSPETVAIEASPKVYCTFLNMENPGQDGVMGADVRFFAGEKYTEFRLFDGQRHVMPKCMIVTNPDDDSKLFDRMVEYWTTLGLKGHHATSFARTHLRLFAIPNRCVNDVVETLIDPITQMPKTVITGRKTPRFQFTEISDAPADAPYGLVVKDKELKKDAKDVQPAA